MRGRGGKEVLGFFGQDRSAAWAEAFRLADVLNRHRAVKRLGVWAEMQRGEWVVVCVHLDAAAV